MTDSQPIRTGLPLPRHLLTRAEVIQKLREERGLNGLTKTAEKYDISPQQIADILAGRAAMSKRVYTRLKYKLHEYFERLPE